MTDRRGSIFQWAAYAAAFLIAYFFSAGVFSHFPLGGCVPTIIPVAIAYAAMLEGSFAGSVFGLCLGLFGCLAQADAGAGLILCGALTGMLAGLCRERKFSHQIPVGLLCAFGGLVLVELVRVLGALLAHRGSLPVLGHIALFETLYSMLLAVPTWFLFRFVHRRFGSGQ